MNRKFYLTHGAILLALLITFKFSFAQPVLNEIYTTPNGSCNATPKTEFFEIYNGNQGGGNAVANLGCYYLITRWEVGGGGANNEGFYVVDLPSTAVTNASGFFTAAPASVGATQTQNGVPCEFTPALNWNAGGVTTQYTWNGASYVSSPVTNLTNMFDETAPAIYIFLYNGSTLSDAVVAGGGGNAASLMSTINGWQNLSLPISCLGSTINHTINFSTISVSVVDFVNQSAGSNNGFAREYDGNCANWTKTAAPPYHTPNTNNPGNVPNTDEFWNVTYSPLNYISTSLSTIDATLTGIQNVTSITATVYRDINNNSTYDNGIDPQYGLSNTYPVAGNSLTIPNIQLPGGSTIFILLTADNGCYYTQNRFTTAGNPLPLKLRSFTASKANGGVRLNWETSFEFNAAAIEVERKSGNDFIMIASVPATNNPSGSQYSYTDNINIKDISLYRLKLVDMDGRYQYSEIRSVKGTGTGISFIISPNPTFGKAVVSLSDISGIDELQVLDLSGRLIQKVKVITNKVELTNLPKGTYMIRVADSRTGESQVQKLSVQ